MGQASYKPERDQHQQGLSSSICMLDEELDDENTGSLFGCWKDPFWQLTNKTQKVFGMGSLQFRKAYAV